METLASWFDGFDIKLPWILTLKFKRPSGSGFDTIVKGPRKGNKPDLAFW